MLISIVPMASHFASLSILFPQNWNSVKYNKKDVKQADQTSLPKPAITLKAMFSLHSSVYISWPFHYPFMTQYQRLKKPCLACKVNSTLCSPDPTLTHQVKKTSKTPHIQQKYTQTRKCPSFLGENISLTEQTIITLKRSVQHSTTRKINRTHHLP